MTRLFRLVPLLLSITIAMTAARAGQDGVAILAYHRFGSAVNDSMTVRTETFRSQLAYLKQRHAPVIPLRSLISRTCRDIRPRRRRAR